MQQGRKKFITGEVAALKQLYIELNGVNDVEFEEVITAAMYESGEMGDKEQLLPGY